MWQLFAQGHQMHGYSGIILMNITPVTPLAFCTDPFCTTLEHGI